MLFVFLASTAVADISGPLRMVDGDTAYVGATKVRLAAIDAPEARQTCVAGAAREFDCGAGATRFARAAFDGRWARCEARGTSYDRVVARCLVDGRDMARVLVRQGWALAAPRYGRDYIRDEALAAGDGLGLHAVRHMAPGTFRRHNPLVAAQPRQGCQIKGNRSRNGWIYHLPGQRFYDATVISPGRGEAWFCTEAEARAAGYRKSRI